MVPTRVPQAPTRRPAWLVVLSLLMLMHGGLSFIGAVTNLRDPKLLATMSLGDVTETPEELALRAKMVTITKGILAGHATAIRVVTIAAIVLALLTLYAVAAILSRDKNGRRLAMITAWSILAYQVGTLPVFLRISHDHASQSAPLTAEFLKKRGSTDSVEVLTTRISSLTTAEPFVVSAFGVGWALLLLAYFGGRRGRQLYGLEPTPLAR